MDLNKFGKRAHACALRRGKVHEGLEQNSLHQETIAGLHEEMNEVAEASETDMSDHLEGYSSVVEELVDVAIAAMTELYRRGINIESALHAKMKYNERRR